MDIVERLKGPMIPEYAQLAADAKNEIERLRKESRLYWDAFQKAANEIERLQYALQWIASCESGDVYEILKEMQKVAKDALKGDRK